MVDLLGVKALYLVATGSALLLALAMHLVHRLQATPPGVTSWKLGSALGAAGFCLVALRGVVPDAVSIVLANALGVLGTVRLQRGFREALGAPPRIALEHWAAGAALVACAVFTYVEPSVSMRVRLLSVIYAAVFAHAAFGLFGRRAVADPNRLAWFAIGIVVAATALIHGYRALSFPDLPPGYDYLSVRSGIEALVLLMVPAQALVLMFGLTYITGWRTVHSLRNEVSARERAMQALVESNSKFASVFQTSLLAMVIGELPDGRFVEVNDAMLDLVGRSRDQMIGRNSVELGLWPDSQRRSAVMERLVRDGRLAASETRVRRADGQLLDVLVAANTFDTANGRLFVSMLADVSALKTAQRGLEARHQDLELVVAERTRELAQARDAAEAASRAKSAFLANMSHEIRTPLNGILGMAYLVRQSGVTDTQRHKLERLEGAGRHLLQVISDVLDLSKIEAGGLVLESRSFTSAELEALVGAVITPLALARQLQLDLDFSGLPPTLVGDSARLAQALINLLSNGVKFTEVGFVRLETLSRRLSGQRCELRFTITDSGIGISAEQQARLFQPFAQADSSVTRRYGGTGLGLAISQRLAQLMGGGISVASQPDAGSAFTLTVQLELPAPQAMPAPRPSATADELRALEARLQAAYAGRAILVVEDDSLSRRYLCDLLTDFGLAVDAAANGREATALCAQRNQPYAVVLMDLHMPELGGLDAAHQIRAMPGQARTPIVAITADTSESQRQACLDQGFAAVLHKPLAPMSLFGVLMGLNEPRSAR